MLVRCCTFSDKESVSMGIYIQPDGTSAEVQPGLGALAPRNLTAQPMARPTGAQVTRAAEQQRAREQTAAAHEAERRREATLRAINQEPA